MLPWRSRGAISMLLKTEFNLSKSGAISMLLKTEKEFLKELYSTCQMPGGTGTFEYGILPPPSVPRTSADRLPPPFRADQRADRDRQTDGRRRGHLLGRPAAVHAQGGGTAGQGGGVRQNHSGVPSQALQRLAQAHSLQQAVEVLKRQVYHLPSLLAAGFNMEVSSAETGLATVWEALQSWTEGVSLCRHKS